MSVEESSVTIIRQKASTVPVLSLTLWQPGPGRELVKLKSPLFSQVIAKVSQIWKFLKVFWA